MARNSLKRKILRHTPVLSKLAKAMDHLEDENYALKQELEKIIFIKETDKFDVSDTFEGIPVPPDVLRFWVAGTENRDWFLNSGKNGLKAIKQVLQKHDLKLEQFESVLDFGCGCSRVLRHLKSYSSVRIYGSDCNQTAIRWCDANIDFAEFGTNGLEPPSRYHDSTFDLVYAFSVFTHFPEGFQKRWMDELYRILKPEGYLLFSVHGDHYFGSLNNEMQYSYKQDQLVVTETEKEGHNSCMAYHPFNYVREHLAGDHFDIIGFYPEGALGNPCQDLYLFKAKK